jgi:hypothetical protein
MKGLLLPAVLLAVAIGLFAAFTNPTYQAAKALAAQSSAYEQALQTAHDLKSQRDQLLAKRDTFSQDDTQKLQRLLPDNVDNIRLIIDVNNIASRHQLTLKNVALGSVGGDQQRTAASVGAAGSPIGTVELGFTVTAGFDNFSAFMLDLEHSLRLVDIEKMSFKDAVGDSADYSVTIRTYWLH